MVVFAGWVNREQQAAIECFQAENKVLRSQLNGRRLRFSDEEMRNLAVKGRVLSRNLLYELACIVRPGRFWRGTGDWLLRSGRIAVERRADRRLESTFVR